MTWLAPGYLFAGALASLAIVALHLLAWRRPPVAALPTARFIPDAPARARARSARPADRLLLALRVLVLLLASAALARPVRVPERRPLARVVIADVSASVADVAGVGARVRQAAEEGDAVVVMDSVARVAPSRDSIPTRAIAHVGRLSAALVAARDAARELAPRADSVVLVIVSPLLREEVDAATPALAARWGGRVLVTAPEPARIADAARAPLRVEAVGDDAVAAGAIAGAVQATADARLVRRLPSASDSAWVSGGAGRVLVSWPATVAAPDAPTAALAWDDDALVAPLGRDSAPATGRPVLRWADGTAAASERPLGDGCVRDVRVSLPRAGDVTLSTGFARLLAHLAAPCGGARDTTRVTPESLGFVRTGSAPALALLRPAPRDPWQVARWLLGAAVVLRLVEPLLRRGAGATGAAGRRESTSKPRAEAA